MACSGIAAFGRCNPEVTITDIVLEEEPVPPPPAKVEVPSIPLPTFSDTATNTFVKEYAMFVGEYILLSQPFDMNKFTVLSSKTGPLADKYHALEAKLMFNPKEYQKLMDWVTEVNKIVDKFSVKDSMPLAFRIIPPPPRAKPIKNVEKKNGTTQPVKKN